MAFTAPMWTLTGCTYIFHRFNSQVVNICCRRLRRTYRRRDSWCCTSRPDSNAHGCRFDSIFRLAFIHRCVIRYDKCCRYPEYRSASTYGTTIPESTRKEWHACHLEFNHRGAGVSIFVLALKRSHDADEYPPSTLQEQLKVSMLLV